MIIKSLAINNLRSYAGKAKVEFATDPGRNVTLIHGVNGAGKTSLFIALNWALFGDQFSYAGHLLNETLLRSKDGEQSANGEASVSFEQEGVEYYLQRGRAGLTRPDGSLLEKESGFELFFFDKNGNSKEERFGQTFLDRLLPPAIRTFFFFDGDRISDFTRPGREQDILITKAVNDMLQLELIERASRHLSMVSRDIDKQIASKGSVEAKRIQARREESTEELRGLQEERHHFEEEGRAARSRKAAVDGRLLQLAEVAERARRRATLDAEISGLSQNIIAQNQDLMDACRDAVSDPVTEKVTSALQFLDEKRRKREIPANYKDQFLRDLLKSHRCICERPLEDGSTEHKHLEELLQITLPGSIQDNAMELAAQVRAILRHRDERKARVLRKLQELETCYKSRDEIENEIKLIGDEIGSSVGEEVLKFENDRKQIDRDLLNLGIELSKLMGAIQKKEAEIEELRKQFEKETEKEVALKNLRKLALLASQSAQAFVKIRETLIGELQADLSETGTEIFKQFTWKTGYFDRVKIGEDYLLSVLDSSGNDLRDGMSMGETQLLSLSFILSMIAISDYEAPLVIDTPLARLSQDVRRNLLSTLPKLTRQLVLLCTDSEMTKEAREILADRIGSEYHLTFADGVTSIAEGAPA